MKKSSLKNNVIKSVALLSLVAPTALGSFATVANADEDIWGTTPADDGSTWWQGGKPGDNTTDVVDHTGNASNTNNTGSNNNTTNNTGNTNKPGGNTSGNTVVDNTGKPNTGATDTNATVTTKPNENKNTNTSGNTVKDPNTTVNPGTDQVLKPTSTVNNSTEKQTSTFGNTATGSTADLNKANQLPQTDTENEGLLATIIKAIKNFFN